MSAEAILEPLTTRTGHRPRICRAQHDTEFLTRHIHDRLADAARSASSARRQGVEGDPGHDIGIACGAGLVRAPV